MKHQRSGQKPHQARRLKKKAQRTTRQAKAQARAPRTGLGTRIARRFRKIGLRPGEEILELREIHLYMPNFED